MFLNIWQVEQKAKFLIEKIYQKYYFYDEEVEETTEKKLSWSEPIRFKKDNYIVKNEEGESAIWVVSLKPLIEKNKVVKIKYKDFEKFNDDFVKDILKIYNIDKEDQISIKDLPTKKRRKYQFKKRKKINQK